MAGRIGRVLAFFTRAEPRGAAPSGWALALDAAVAVGAAAGAVYEMAARNLTETVFVPDGGPAAVGLDIRAAIAAHAVRLVAGHPMLVGPPHASLALLIAAALTALPLAWRRLSPVWAWLVIIAAIVAVHGSYVPPVALGTAVYAAYSAMTHSRYRNLAIAVVSATTVLATAALGGELPRFPGRLTAVFAIFPAAAAGLGIRELRRRLADSTARLHRAAGEAAAATARALAAERARIAAELHDVVTHNVSVMIVQAGAARKIMASSPADAEDALLAVESTGREAMTELRNLLGLLSPAPDGRGEAVAVTPAGVTPRAGLPSPGSSSGSSSSSSYAGVSAARMSSTEARTAVREAAGADPAAASLRPQPGLRELETLIGRVSNAGLPVDLQVSGIPRPLSPGADLAAYRVVQEGLTNVLRHAGGAAASVQVCWDGLLQITVSDDGRGGTFVGLYGNGALADSRGLADNEGLKSAGDGDVAGHGRGLLGLHERLALYGGDLTAGPRPEGGWQLRAVLPLTEQHATAGEPVMTVEHDPPGERPAEHSPTVVIADDQALVRGGFRLILKAAGIDVVAEAADGAQAVAAARAHRPDVVLMDIRMPVMDGIEATRQILADAPPGDTDGGGPPTRIIILTTFDLDAYVYAALTAGASGFLLKDVTPEHLVAAVQLVRTGDALLAPSITRRLVERFAATSGRAGLPHGATNLVRPSEPGEPQSLQPGPGQLRGTGRRPGTPGGDAASALTPRELEVLGLVARGMSNAEIAAALILAEATVKTHVARILTKLGLRDRVQAVVLAYETGLVFPAGTAD